VAGLGPSHWPFREGVWRGHTRRRCSASGGRPAMAGCSIACSACTANPPGGCRWPWCRPAPKGRPWPACATRRRRVAPLPAPRRHGRRLQRAGQFEPYMYGRIWQPDPGSGPTCGGPAEEGETRRGGERVRGRGGDCLLVSWSPPLLVSKRGGVAGAPAAGEWLTEMTGALDGVFRWVYNSFVQQTGVWRRW
jgi:hypothetical protein